MTLVACLLVVEILATASLCVLVVVADEMDREKADQQEPYYPSYAEWTKDGATTRLAPGPPAARAGVHRAPSVGLIPEPGEDEWRFPAWPGDR